MQYIIATHGRLAQGYADTLKLVTQSDCIYPICAYEEEAQFPENMMTLLETFESGEPVVVFTDLLGGSVTQKIMELWGNRPGFYVLAGVNLPLVIELVLSGLAPTPEVIGGALSLAREQMVYVNQLLENMSDDSLAAH